LRRSRAIAQLAEHFDVHPNQITTWKAQLESGAADVSEIYLGKRTIDASGTFQTFADLFT